MSDVISGGYSVRVPPLPIPNREVKPHRADGTAYKWESRSPPFSVSPPEVKTSGGLFCMYSFLLLPSENMPSVFLFFFPFFFLFSLVLSI